MTQLAVQLSRYALVLLIAVYTWENFRYFSLPDGGRRRVCHVQNVCMFAVQAVGFAVLWLIRGEKEVLIFAGLLAAFIFLYLLIWHLLYRNRSRLLLNNMCMLLSTGLLILYRLSPERAVKQLFFACLAAVMTLSIPLIVDRVWQLSRIPWVYGLLGLFLLLAVCVVGGQSFGSRISISVGGFTLQPSEFVKLSYVFFIATMFYRSTEWKNLVPTTLVAAAHVLVLVLSRDLGSALIFFLTYLLMLFVATGSVTYLITGLAAGVGAAVPAYHLFSHVRNRVEAYLDPFKDITGTGYQVAQGLFAIGTGGWFGSGIGKGMPKKIPVVEKDFIFAAISEELGGFYAVCLLLLCLGCFIQMMIIASALHSLFYKLVAFGLGVEYAAQTILTIGGVIKFIPSTGVTLPFVSYGGSSLFSTFILFCVIEGLYILRRDTDELKKESEEET